MKLLLLTFIIGLSINAQAYYGKNSTEGILAFKGKIELKNAQQYDKQEYGDYWTYVYLSIQNQATYLMGVFQSNSFVKGYTDNGAKYPGTKYRGALGGAEQFEIEFDLNQLQDSPFVQGNKVIEYNFKSKVVFDIRKFSKRGSIRSIERAKTTKIPIKLPLDPESIYDLGIKEVSIDRLREEEAHGLPRVIAENGEETNRVILNTCTDTHYNSYGDFWYFWDPDQRGCALKNDNRNIFRTTGNITRIENTKKTYPEYDQLYGENIKKNQTLKIGIGLGFADDVIDIRQPNYEDITYEVFDHVNVALANLGYEWDEKDRVRYTRNGRRLQGINTIMTYRKSIMPAGFDQKLNVEIKLLVADTSIDSRDQTFHYAVQQAFQNYDIIIYDGHSGLGGNLDFDSMSEALRSNISLNKDKYQIIYFNGCSSYPYFNGDYFAQKKSTSDPRGSKKLDLILSSLPTYFFTAGPNIMAFLTPFLQGEHPTYQVLMDDVEKSNRAEFGSYLTGVTGDEDNIWSPSN